MRMDIKTKQRRGGGLEEGETSVSTLPHLNFFLHSWQQFAVSSQCEVGLGKKWKRKQEKGRKEEP